MKDIKTGKSIDLKELDANFAYLQQFGILNFLKRNCLLDYVTNDSFDLLHKIFTKRTTLKELIHHPFVQRPPNPQLLISMIQHVADYKKKEYMNYQKNIAVSTKEIAKLHQNRLQIQAKAKFLL